MASKRLIIVVDSAAELNSHWQTSLRDLVADIVRSLHQDGSTSQDPGAQKPSLGLVVYGSQGPCTESQVLPWGWTNDVNTFLAWLSAVRFTSGDYSEIALANGLSTALKTIAASGDSNEVQVFGQAHCILVTSYKSLPLLTSVQENGSLDNEKFFLQKLDRFLADATSAASKFVQSFVSLSIMSPEQSPRLKELFWAGNVFKPRAEYCPYDRENLTYLILLSDNFMEAHAALGSRKFIIKPADNNYKGKGIDFGTSLVPSSKGKCPDGDVQTSGDNFTLAIPVNQSQISLDKLAEIEVLMLELESDYDYDVKGRENNIGESSTNQHVALAKIMPTVDDMMASLQDAMNQPVASLIQEQVIDNRVHGGDDMAFALVPWESAMDSLESNQENQIIDLQSLDSNAVAFNNQKKVPLEYNAQLEDGVRSSKLMVAPKIGHDSSSSYLASRSKTVNTIPFCNPNHLEVLNCSGSQTAGKGTMSSFPVNPEDSSINRLKFGGLTQYHCWAAPSESHLGIGTSRELIRSKKWENMVNLGRHSSTFNVKTSKNARRCSWEQMTRVEHRAKRRFANVDQSSKDNLAGCDSRLVNSELGGKYLALTTAPSPYASVDRSERAPIGYAKAWEGNITMVEEGETLVISRLVAYMKNSASETLFMNWPSRLLMEQLIPKIYVDEMQMVGKVEYLLVDAMLPRSKIEQIEKEVLCAYMKLPQQTLVLFPFVRGSRFVAALYSCVLDIPSRGVSGPSQ